jgi:hypothetical protein
MKSWKSLSIVFLFLVTVATPAYAAQWSPPQNQSNNNAGLNIVESFFNTGESVSRIEVTDNSTNSGPQGVHLCKQFGETPCDGTSRQAFISAFEVLPTCSPTVTDWCVEGLSIYSKDNLTVIDQAKLIRSVNGPIINKNVDADLPQGGNISLWKADGQTNSGNAQTYAVYAFILGNANAGGKFTFHDFRAMVLPYSEISGSQYRTGAVSEFTLPNGRKSISISGAAQECAWTEDGKCGLMQDFPSGSRARLTVRIGKSLSGWLMGRMTNPNIEVNELSPTQSLLTVDSEPAEVPKFYVSINKSQITPEISSFDPALRDGNPGVHNQLANQTPFDLAAAWAKFSNDKAAGLITTWSISTTNNGRGSNCLSNTSKLLGVVSTNSMLYEGNAPNFIDGSLSYKVFGLHMNPDGSTFQGKYDLIMRSETARCLYGFSNAPVNASVSITSADGAEQVATTVLSEKAGWLHLGAYGFTFSSPTIKVKLTQVEELPAEKPEVKSTIPIVINNSLGKTFKITCARNKVKKVIAGAKPVCPAGYKKV